MTTLTEDLKTFKKRLRFGYRPKAFDFEYDVSTSHAGEIQTLSLLQDDGLISNLAKQHSWSHIKLEACAEQQPVGLLTIDTPNTDLLCSFIYG